MTRLSRRQTLALTAAALAAPALPARAADEIFTNWRGRAIRGYDPVAYFTQGKAVEGSSDFAVDWKGARWHFASAANRDAFVKDPMKYAPQFGGYCAYAVSQGYTAPVDPEAWDIVEGRLYLNYSKSVQTRWKGDRATYIKQGHANWPKVLD